MTPVQATTTAGCPCSKTQRGEHRFFAGMAWLLLAANVIAFARPYYLAGLLAAPLPSPVIHVHAVVATAWMVFFTLQVSMAAPRLHLHRRLGLGGAVLACLLIATGVPAGADTLRRGVPPGGQAPLLFLINISMLGVFATLTVLGYRMRRQPPTHKRLMLLANVGLIFSAMVRWPSAWLYHDLVTATRASHLFLLPLVLYDLWNLRRIHPATLWGSLAILALYEARFRLAETMPWQALAAWVQAP
jgi:FtsH-binding integral membrane protein